MEDVPLYTVSHVLRHSTTKTTERYAHLHPENVRVAMGILERLSRSGHAKRGEDGEEVTSA
jgi:hypothetical protein